MIKKLWRSGLNSLAIVIDKNILKKLNAIRGDYVYIADDAIRKIVPDEQKKAELRVFKRNSNKEVSPAYEENLNNEEEEKEEEDLILPKLHTSEQNESVYTPLSDSFAPHDPQLTEIKRNERKKRPWR